MSNAYSSYSSESNSQVSGRGLGAIPQPCSRIENDVERVKSLGERVNTIASRIHRHAQAMGYYQPTPEIKGNAPTPVVLTMADALGDLDRAIDAAIGSLNLFE